MLKDKAIMVRNKKLFNILLVTIILLPKFGYVMEPLVDLSKVQELLSCKVHELLLCRAKRVRLSKAQGLLFRGAITGDVVMVQEALTLGAHVNESDLDDRTALMKAVKANSSQVVQLLLEQGADVNAWDDSGFTAIDNAQEPLRKMMQAYDPMSFAFDEDGKPQELEYEGLMSRFHRTYGVFADSAFSEMNKNKDLKEPKLSDYVKRFYEAGKFDQTMSLATFDDVAKIFKQDLKKYWLRQFQDAYCFYCIDIHRNADKKVGNSGPLLDLFCNQLHKRPDRRHSLRSCFKSPNFLKAFIEQLEGYFSYDKDIMKKIADSKQEEMELGQEPARLVVKLRDFEDAGLKITPNIVAMVHESTRSELAEEERNALAFLQKQYQQATHTLKK